VIKSGIVLIFIPLLTLSADVMHKFEAYNPTWVNVGVYHLDEMYDCDHQLYSSFLLSCSSMRRDTSSTFFVFLSPLINHRNALAVFVACAHDRTLRAIAMDEAHIQVQHGTSFREKIRALRIEFFKKIFGNQPRDLRLRMIALTVNMSIGDCVLRGSPEDFRQREITMNENEHLLQESTVRLKGFSCRSRVPSSQPPLQCNRLLQLTQKISTFCERAREKTRPHEAIGRRHQY